MNLFEENNWDEKLNPLIEKYKGKKHPLNYENTYQLMIAVILSAQDSDANINKLTPGFFAEFPNLEVIATSSLEELIPLINKIKNFGNKSNWIKGIAQTLKKDEKN